MMFPSVFGENLFDDWMDDFGFRDNFFSGKNPLYGKHAKNIMKTDVRETDKGYELDVDLPGFKKDEVQVQLKDGYLTISAAKGLDKDEEDSHLGDFIQDDNVPVPADAAAFTLLKEQLVEVLSTLTDREQKVLRLRFGLDDGRARTLEEVGKEFNVTRERIRQIEAKALRKLRHPSRSRKLKDYLD